MLEQGVYDKIEDWVLGGGHLITAPGPPNRDLLRRPARLATLFPLQAATTEWLDVWRVWWNVIVRLVPYALFQRPWLSDRHRSSGHIIDLFEPVLDCLRSPVAGRRFEVRLAAPPGGRDYGRLAVMLAPAVAAERLFDVGPGAFQPPPRVWSAVVRLTVRAPPLFVVSPHYAPLVAAAFSRRRKTLRNALGELMSREDISACGIDPGARPERLAPQDFNTLAQALDRAGAGR